MIDRSQPRSRWRGVCASLLALLIALAPRTADALTVNAGLVLLTGSVSPSVGTVAGGTTVNITSVESLLAIAENVALKVDLNLLGLVGLTVDGSPTLADVEFDGIPTPGPDIQQSLFTVRSVAPAHAPGPVNIDLVYKVYVKAKLLIIEETVEVIVRLRMASGFTYVGAPTLTSVAPNSGPETGGTTVTFAGSNFRSGMIAKFGGVPATNLLVASPTSLTAKTPAGSGTVAVTLENPDGEVATVAGGFTYTPTVVPPTVTTMQPSSGPSSGGTPVLVTGTGFQPGAAVTVGGAAATQVIVGNTTQLTFVTPAAPGAAGSYPVSIVNPDGGAVNAGAFTFQAQSTPAITGFSPTSGPAGGGVTTVITGTGFETGAIVRICGVNVTPSLVTATSVVFTTPACGTPGNSAVTVTNPDGGTATAPGAYTFTPAPAISTVAPATGRVDGGTVVTISGSNFQTGAAVLFDASAATNVVVADATTILATTPAHAAGAVSVRVVNPDGGQIVAPNGFTYAALSTPDIISAAPTQGTPGMVIILTGTGFMPGAVFTMCGETLPVVYLNATTVSIVVPLMCTPGVKDITLTNPDGGTDTFGGGFQVGAGVSTPTATAVSPNQGPVTGGTQVIITGTEFLSGATVTFGGMPATSVSVVSSTLITATTAAAGVPGAVDVQVMNPDTGTATLPGGFTYLAQSTPTISALSPAQGPTSGGTLVVATGTAFAPGATVLMDATPVTVSAVTPTAITFTTPACAAGPHALSVINTDGGTTTMPGAFMCVDASQPTVTAVTPAYGPTAGGTPVQVLGTAFAAGATVSFDGVPLTNVVVLSPTVLTGTTGAHATGSVSVLVTNSDGGSATLANAFTYRADACEVTADDADGDCLPDAWERKHGLDPTSSVCPDGPSCDPDGDGDDNGTEFTNDTHPRGFYRQYFAEGAISELFRTTFHLVTSGPPTTTAHVQVRYLRQGGLSAGQSASTSFTLEGTALRVVDPVAVLGVGSHEFATVVESDQVVAAARTVSWDHEAYGSHAEIAVATPSTTWHFAEGATISGFQLFYLLSNPAAQDATVTMTYLRPGTLAPIVRTHTVPARGRVTVWVNHEAPELAAEEVSTMITATIPVLAERAMYRNTPSRIFASGHVAAGVTAPRASWFFAEGSTGPYFDTFLLVSNPHTVDVPIRVTYLLPDGSTRSETFVIGRQSRFNIWVDTRPGLENTAFSARIDVVGDGTVIAERSMWWPGDGSSWSEGHVSAGAEDAGTAWVVAQGVAGGPNNAETYVLVGNVGEADGTVQVDVVAEDGTHESQVITVAASSRANILVTDMFPSMANRRFGVLVTSLGAQPAPIVVEGSVYNDSGNARWEAGASALGTRLR